MVGVGMGLQQPLNLQTFGFDLIYKSLGRGAAGPGRRRIIVENAVDNGAGSGARVAQDMADGEGGLVKKRFDDGVLSGISEGGLDQARGMIKSEVLGRIRHGRLHWLGQTDIYFHISGKYVFYA